jgi:myo-inositol 2-dehydrogenase/D-chiro-inositol 1-dehydrogenase
MKPIRIGILSFAHYHANFWSEAFQADERASLVGIWDTDQGRGHEACLRYGTHFHDDPGPLIDSVDAVAICSETADHRPLIERAAGCARHILCEKPIATSLQDADAIAHAVGRSGVSFMQSFPKRLDPINLELRALVQSGSLGRIWLARIRHGHSHGRDAAFTAGWWADPERSGGGTLIDEGIHATDFLRWLFGDPHSVHAAMSNATLGLRVDDSALAVFQWSSGLIGEVVTGWNMQAADESVEIYGTEGTALLSGVDLASRSTRQEGFLRVWREHDKTWRSSPTIPQFVLGKFHHQSARAFLDCLTSGEPPPSGLKEGRAALAMIVAAYASAQEGRIVRLAEVARSSPP